MADWTIIKKLIQIVKEEDISGLAIEENGVKYEVKREKGGVSAMAPAAVTVPANAVVPKAVAADTEEAGLVAITSPMVGTFYSSPSPESPAFVGIGDQVAPGKVVCIIEAMKLFNEIEAEVKGQVHKLLVENGQPIEYGQKLMLIKKG